LKKHGLIFLELGGEYSPVHFWSVAFFGFFGWSVLHQWNCLFVVGLKNQEKYWSKRSVA
jgi:hypothetical protein